MKKILLYGAGAANLGIIAWFWWQGAGVLFAYGFPNILIALGRLSGLLLAYFVLQQFLFMSRAPWLERAFGMDKLSRVHRWTGYAVLALLIAHAGLLVWGYARAAEVSLWAQFADFILHYDDVLWAFIAAVFLLAVVAVSLAIARRRLRYETWYVTHLFVYAVVALAFFHQLSIGSDLLASAAFRFYWYALYVFILGNFLWFRWGRQLWRLCRHGFTVERVVRESPDASSFYITGRGMQKLAIHAGQFVIVRFLTAGLWWQAHPFSVSSVFDGGHIRITIKDKGDFTRAVQSLQPGVKVMLDGPLGSMTARRSRHHKVLLLAGGVGITP
ncbi:MAG TPA: ferric reductase-like transmembrane domain-containing protein, partial [Patescibacteria group bacterium]|nr:ferric reductase-like transmembrane domain-containing protein [Patescibacteria group bacterium]